MAKFIFGTYIIPQKLRFLAKEYHRRHGDYGVFVDTLYRVSRNADGSGSTEWLLTRFHNKTGEAYSAILIVEDEHLTEYFSCMRRDEKIMIESWKAFMEEEDDG